MKEAFAEVRFTQAGISRPEAETSVIAGDRDDPSVRKDFNYSKIVENAVIIILATFGGMDIPCV